MRRVYLLLPALLVAAAACLSAGEEAPSGSPSSGRSAGGTDISRHSVPLEEIHFDTFDGGSVPLSEISESKLLSLRDAIPPLDSPKYDDAAAGDGWLQDDDLVIGYEGAEGAYAYPIKILNFHEIVNDELDGVPVLVSYCPLCRSGIVYSRVLDGRELSFGNTSALYESDLVMYDRKTFSYWWQVAGRAIVGSLAGQQMEPLPSITTTWAQWRELHPDTRVLSRDTGYGRNYQRDPFQGYAGTVNAGRYPFPVSERVMDGRLAPADEVLGVTLNGASKAYPLRLLGEAAINDSSGGEAIVVFSSQRGPAGAAFLPQAGGRSLTFEAANGAFRDRETGSEWNLDGRAVAGPLKGSRLERLPSRYTFWFAYVAAFPEAEVYEP